MERNETQAGYVSESLALTLNGGLDLRALVASSCSWSRYLEGGIFVDSRSGPEHLSLSELHLFFRIYVRPWLLFFLIRILVSRLPSILRQTTSCSISIRFGSWTAYRQAKGL